jgi:hypothetical protein
MIVGIDTIASDDGGHRGTGGGDGEDRWWMVGQGEYSKYESLCTVGGRYGSVRSPGGGRCMYVHGKDECDVLWQMIPMRIDMVQVRLG